MKIKKINISYFVLIIVYTLLFYFIFTRNIIEISLIFDCILYAIIIFLGWKFLLWFSEKLGFI